MKILLKNLYFWENYSNFVFEKFGKKCDEKNETYSSGKFFSLKSCRRGGGGCGGIIVRKFFLCD